MQLALHSLEADAQMDESPEMFAIVRALARHLREFPQHSDTAEGIATWWFRDQAVVDEGALMDALSWMLERGLIEVRTANCAADRYRCASTTRELDRVLQQLSKRKLT